MIFLYKRKKLRFHTWMNEQKFIKSRERYLGTNLNIYIKLISLTNVKSSRYPYSRRFNDTRRISVPSSVRFIDFEKYRGTIEEEQGRISFSWTPPKFRIGGSEKAIENRGRHIESSFRGKCSVTAHYDSPPLVP